METLQDLIWAHSQTPTSRGIIFLDDVGNVNSSLSYSELYSIALRLSLRLLDSYQEVKVVISHFLDTRSHIITFWACCLAGVSFCPLPAVHPDPKCQSDLFLYLQELLPNSIIITDERGCGSTHELVTTFRSVLLQDLIDASPDAANSLIAPPPHRQARPEDVVALMLTSGSTGKPKAVVLRHSTLLSSCKGKIKYHLTTSTSRFLNWIAFDHVASLSEIHIHAMLVNASQYHITPTAIVNRPRLLLELCSTYRVAYTFSPNFLLAQIVQDVQNSGFSTQTQLSSLRSVISGGEAVPMTTAVAFTNLVHGLGTKRDVLCAGFGMTETAAGSIYNRVVIPTQVEPDLDFLSVGTCCEGISLRIVDRDGIRVPTNELGALQVSGPTVFTEYYRNLTATYDAFTSDGWFMTGDIGRIDADGRLHLTGRAKDVLNLNGVKTSTARVESYIADAQIPGMAGNVVFVCPMRLGNAQTETYTVFYQHDSVSLHKDLSFADLGAIQRTNMAIRSVCTVMCSQSPHVILPLPCESFRRTALGKVSRHQLVVTYLSGKYAFIDNQLRADAKIDDMDHHSILQTDLGRVIVDCAMDVFHWSGCVQPSTNLFDLGASSMHLMRFKNRLQESIKELPDIPTIELLRRPVIGDLYAYLHSRQSVKRIAPVSVYQPVVCFNSTGSRAPIFLIHPGVGEVLVFINLARALTAIEDRPVYALRARGFDWGETPFGSLSEMVNCYTDAIIRVQDSGPFYISGYSYGGAIAFEVGKKLESKGLEVKWLGIMNLPPEIQFRMKELNWSEVLLNICMFLSLVPSDTLQNHREALLAKFPVLKGSEMEPRNAAVVVGWIFRRCSQDRLEELQLGLPAFLRWVKVAYEVNRTGRAFEPAQSIRGALTTVFCAIPLPSMGTREEFKAERLARWEEYSGRMFEMVDVDGEHYTMLSEEHVASFAEKMNAALSRAARMSP